MASAQTFLQSLREDPEDRTTLLVFADWLTDQADPILSERGELIHVQTALSGWVADVEQREPLQERERELLQRLGPVWLEPVLPLCRSWSVRNGLTSITASAEDFLLGPLAREAHERLAQAWVFSVRLEDCSAVQAALLARAEPLRLLTCLNLSGNELDDLTVRLLARSPHLAGLTALDLSNNQVGDSGLQELLLSPHLTRLTRLDLRNNHIRKGASLELTLHGLPRLRELELHGNDLEPACQVALAEFRRLQRRPDLSAPAEPAPRLVNSIGLELALVPAGSFRMGSPETEYASERSANGPAGADERPQHLVALTAPFYLGVYPVTQRQYALVMGVNPAEFNDSNRGGPDHPVERVSWAEAHRFCERLSALPEERDAGRLYRLPTEAEWEHACRAGTGTPFWWGETASSNQANFDGSLPYGPAPRALYLARTTRVGSYPANAFGLCDMHGNVWEWCQDYYEPRFYDKSPPHDPLGPADGNRKCARGGSWSNSAADCRSACRDYWYGVDYARNNIGFRVAMTVSR